MTISEILEMKNKNRPADNPQPLTVSVAVRDFRFLRQLVEKLAWQPYCETHRPEWVTPECRSLTAASIEAFVMGKFKIDTPTEQISMSFTSSFFFTCTRDNGSANRLTWSMSLN